MFKPPSIADRHTLRPSAAQESADTTINVNNGGGRVPPSPDFSHASRVSQITRPEHSDRYRVTAPTLTPRTETVTHREINWGGIMKGVALVAGVVLVAAVAYAVVPAALTSMGVIGPSGFLTGAIEAVSPAVSTVGGYLMQGLNVVDDFVFQLGGHLFNALGLSGAASSATAAVTTASAATVGAVNTATGAIAAGATVAFGAPMAVKSMLATPTTTLVDTTHVTTTGLHDAGASQTQSTTTVTHPTPDSHKTGEHLLNNDAPDVIDPNYGRVNDEAAASMKTSKMAHHAAHHADHKEDGHQAESGEAPEENRLRSTVQKSQAWAERVGTRGKHSVTPRDSQFAQQLAEDRAHLDAALAERS